MRHLVTNLRGISRWRWMFLATVVGLLLAVVQNDAADVVPDGNDARLQAEFEGLLRRPLSPNGFLRIKDIKIDSLSSSTQLVSATRMVRLLQSGASYCPITFRVSVPFKPVLTDGLIGQPGTYHSVQSFIDSVRAHDRHIPAATSRWWNSGMAQGIQWFLISFVLIGVVWPSFLGAIQRPDATAQPASSEAAPTTATTALNSNTDPTELDKFIESAHSSLSGYSADSATAVAQVDDSPTPADHQAAGWSESSNDPQEPAVAVPAGSEKNYHGEFYPVARSAAHRDRDSCR